MLAINISCNNTLILSPGPADGNDFCPKCSHLNRLVWRQRDAAQVTPVQSVNKLVQIPRLRMQSETVAQLTDIWPATSGHGLQGEIINIKIFRGDVQCSVVSVMH